jgi:NTP pyrophosphatase (non-canonical NTP hydrolase)
MDKHLNFNTYQEEALKTAIYDKEGKDPLSYCILGLVGEAGEVANKYKKVIRGDKPLDDELRLKIASELGDVQWYLAATCKELGFTLEEVAHMNIDKLYSRRSNNTIMGDGDER